MASKVMVKIPVQPFGQVSKGKGGGGGAVVSGGGEVVAIGRTTEIRQDGAQKSPDASRVAQLEQNIRYLQEQHQLMLTGLHHEIDSLRHRNRELQFQLVFAKGTNVSTPSSPEEELKHKFDSLQVYNSPKTVNIAPLQVELLEKELSELKVQLQESESRNVYLSAIVDEQKKKLERYERDRERERERGIQPDPELLRKLDDAEALIQRLRRENSDLRRENAAYQPAREYHNRDGGYQQQQRGGGNQGRGNGRNRGNGGGGGGGGGNGGGNHYRGNWFPPLHSQSYWQQNGRGQERNGSSASVDGSLPSLQANGTGGGGGGNGGQYHGKRGGNNNQYNGEGRKYRGNQNRGQKPS